MRSIIQKWGNSLAVRIPQSFAKDIHLKQGVIVNISLKKGSMVISPQTTPNYSLSKMLKETHPHNIHKINN